VDSGLHLASRHNRDAVEALVEHGGTAESGANARRFAALKPVLSLLARGVGLVFESLPLDLLRGSRPGSADFADEITEFAAPAEIDQPKLNHLVIVDAGVGSVRIPEYLRHGSMFCRGFGFGCDLSHSRPKDRLAQESGMMGKPQQGGTSS
jgi:hypothetical protein